MVNRAMCHIIHFQSKQILCFFTLYSSCLSACVRGGRRTSQTGFGIEQSTVQCRLDIEEFFFSSGGKRKECLVSQILTNKESESFLDQTP